VLSDDGKEHSVEADAVGIDADADSDDAVSEARESAIEALASALDATSRNGSVSDASEVYQGDRRSSVSMYDATAAKEGAEDGAAFETLDRSAPDALAGLLDDLAGSASMLVMHRHNPGLSPETKPTQDRKDGDLDYGDITLLGSDD